MERVTDIVADQLGVDKEKIPAKRLGEAHEIADAVLYLASDSAAYMTGEIITIDGGLTP